MMKFFVLLFLIGCAAANFHEVLDEEAEYVYQEFMLGLEDSGALKDALGYDLLLRAEDDIKTEMGKRLRESLNEILEKMKEAKDRGLAFKEDLLDKAKEVRQKLKDLKEDMGTKAREALKKIREEMKDYYQKIMDMFNKRSLDGQELSAEFNLRELFQKLKKALLDKVDKEKLKAKIEELFGRGNEMADSLLDLINKKGDKYKEKLLDLVDRYLNKDKKRSLKEYWEKVKDYFRDLQLELKEKYMKFGEWVKEHMNKRKDQMQDRIQNLKDIANEFMKNAKDVSKDVAVEAREFLRPYKEDLGSLWDQLKDTVQDIVNRKD